MSTCTFFGHWECPENIKESLRNMLIELIETKGVDAFYVGNQGSYDSMVRSVLRELKEKYPSIEFAVVLAYMPREQDIYDPEHYNETMLPEGIETVPKRFAISWRNKWMVNNSDYVVSYINHDWGGAAQFVELARRKKKIIYNLGQS